MGNSLCCCCCDDTADARRPPGRGFRVVQTAAQLREQRDPVCSVCGKRMDFALLDGHEETCRAAARRQMMRRPPTDDAPTPSRERETVPLTTPDREDHRHGGNQQQNYDTTATTSAVSGGGGDGDDDENLCIVCWENKKAIALVPCGHFALCESCAKSVDECPLCRGPRQGLLRVDLAAEKCRVCRHVIAPAFLTSHQEVCRLRQKELREQLRLEHEKASSAQFSDRGDDAGAATVGGEGGKCVSCLTNKHDTALIPCGHVLCGSCAAKCIQCPICLRHVASRMVIYD